MGLRFAVVSVCALLAPVSDASATVITYDDLAEFQASTGALAVETFERSPPWTSAFFSLSQPVVHLGISWVAAEGLSAVTSLSFSESQAITSGDSTPDPVTDSLTGSLPVGITAVGGWVANAGQGNNVQLTAFDESEAVIGSVVAPLASLSFGEFRFIGITSDTQEIRRVEFLSLQGEPGDDFGLDDFYFGVVPEPSSGLLLSLGAVGFGAFRRRLAG